MEVFSFELPVVRFPEVALPFVMNLHTTTVWMRYDYGSYESNES